MTKVTKEKRPGRKSPWGVVWKDSEGKRKTKFFRTQEKRDVYAKDLEERLSKHGTTALDVDVAKWAHYRELEEKLGGISLEVAVDYYIKNQRPQATRPIDEVVKAFIEDRELAGVSEDYLRHVRKELERFRIAFTGQPIALIGTPELTKWIYALPFVAETKGNYRKRLHALWRFAKLQGWINDNPVQAVPVPKFARPEPVIYSVQEVREILAKAWETWMSISHTTWTCRHSNLAVTPWSCWLGRRPCPPRAPVGPSGATIPARPTRVGILTDGNGVKTLAIV